MKDLIIFVLVFCLFSCANNKEELPTPEDKPLPGPVTITYTQHTKRLFDTYCISCHAPASTQANFPLTTYQEVTANTYSNIGGIIENRVLIQQNMPPTASQTGFLTAAEKDTLQWWINQGAPE